MLGVKRNLTREADSGWVALNSHGLNLKTTLKLKKAGCLPAIVLRLAITCLL